MFVSPPKGLKIFWESMLVNPFWEEFISVVVGCIFHGSDLAPDAAEESLIQVFFVV